MAAEISGSPRETDSSSRYVLSEPKYAKFVEFLDRFNALERIRGNGGKRSSVEREMQLAGKDGRFVDVLWSTKEGRLGYYMKSLVFPVCFSNHQQTRQQ